MEVKIVISGASSGGADQGTTTIQIDSGAASGSRPQPTGSQPGGVSTTSPLSAATPPAAEGMQDTNALPAGQAMGGTGAPGGGEMAAASAVQPPAELLRAAAAIGAASAGPAPMLTGPAIGMALGEPQQFTGAAADAAVMASSGAPDQTAGAAPESERMMPTETTQEQPPEGGSE